MLALMFAIVLVLIHRRTGRAEEAIQRPENPDT
jgi:hypothetical protein